MRVLALCGTAAIVAAVVGCTRPVPGVLTLAPAGMTLQGTTQAQADGSLLMDPGATAESTVYVDAGGVSITITAEAAAVGRSSDLTLWFAGGAVGTVHVQGSHPQQFPFQVHARASGPTALRIVIPPPAGAEANGPAVHVQKIVVTEP